MRARCCHVRERLLAENLETLAPGRYEVFGVGIGERSGTFELIIPPHNGVMLRLQPRRALAASSSGSKW
jgi:hypothetical protein